jgi:hypothetical protein
MAQNYPTWDISTWASTWEVYSCVLHPPEHLAGGSNVQVPVLFASSSESFVWNTEDVRVQELDGPYITMFFLLLVTW